MEVPLLRGSRFSKAAAHIDVGRITLLTGQLMLLTAEEHTPARRWVHLLLPRAALVHATSSKSAWKAHWKHFFTLASMYAVIASGTLFVLATMESAREMKTTQTREEHWGCILQVLFFGLFFCFDVAQMSIMSSAARLK